MMVDQKNETPAKADTPAPAAKAADAVAGAANATAKAAAAPARKARAAKAARKPRAAKPPRPRRTAAQKTAPRKAAVTRSVNQINRNVNEGTRKMKNQANQAADRLQGLFGDVSQRTQGAIERSTRIAEELGELSRGNVEAIVASTKIAARGLETVGQEVAEFGRRSFEDASTAFKGFVEVKSATDFFRLQSEFARTQFDSLVSETSKLSETMIKLAGEVAEPITGRYSVAAERVKNAVAA